ncbi:hypothetical protein AVEN_42389-1 [Araneus ventricosus]|uniref:Uncharacterized protein n=1 Tax=Araneus ventricosus TaxID=182803 RepID=A0A4Y2NUW4_ARAVE|nr:hypothetical protein AVEN_42389-1 [Araneus ventricosus]
MSRAIMGIPKWAIMGIPKWAIMRKLRKCPETHTYSYFTITINIITPSCKSILVNLKDRPPRQHRQALRFLQNSLHCERLMQHPRKTGVRPVFGDGSKEPHHHYCAIGLTRACLLIRQPLIRWGILIEDDSEILG